MDDEKLVQRAKRGDDTAFGDLFRRHVDRAFRAAAAVLRNREDAEDAVQEAAIEGHRSLQRLANDGAFGSWFIRIVVNKSIDRLRRRRRQEGRTALHDMNHVPVPGRDIEARLDLANAVALLPPAQQAIIQLYFVEGYSTPEIAALLGKPEGTIRRLLSDSYRQLRHLLGEEKDEQPTPR